MEHVIIAVLNVGLRVNGLCHDGGHRAISFDVRKKVFVVPLHHIASVMVRPEPVEDASEIGRGRGFECCKDDSVE